MDVILENHCSLLDLIQFQNFVVFCFHSKHNFQNLWWKLSASVVRINGEERGVSSTTHFWIRYAFGLYLELAINSSTLRKLHKKTLKVCVERRKRAKTKTLECVVLSSNEWKLDNDEKRKLLKGSFLPHLLMVGWIESAWHCFRSGKVNTDEHKLFSVYDWRSKPLNNSWGNIFRSGG